ncbi:unnamed protein product [Effrenium voratum]|uniref:tRNA pseudouridine synthase n=2 Tax=Effrenium voratum TaxID=2562239 RepID=A0AA36JCH7_9DINO|nr:unnamed protein product [Effrenium voratum]CAJ1457169.1 unnamed protein product [Effrenium voratum]
MALARGRFRGLRFAGSAVLAVLGVPSCALQRWKMQVAYDGSSFYGWQHQESRRSVHGVLLAALTASHPQHSASRQRPKLVGCSRTDRGVHAEAQVAHCDLLPLEPSALLQRVNRRLPGDVRVLALEPVSNTFHARKSALRKCYRYDLLQTEATPFQARFVWSVGDLDVPLMAQAAQYLSEELDCRCLTVRWRASCRPGVDVYDEDYYGPIRKRLAIHVSEGELVSIHVESDAFLYRMVRVLVTALVAIGRRALDPAEMKEGRREAAMQEVKGRLRLAPPNGLFLQNIVY